jgi:hypothetical protein
MLGKMKDAYEKIYDSQEMVLRRYELLNCSRRVMKV